MEIKKEKGEKFAKLRNYSYLCSVKCMFDYPGRIPRGQDYIDTTHFRKPLFSGFFFCYISL